MRVYQDTAETLVKKNAELIGLRELASKLKTQLLDIDHELSRLSARRAEFEQLKRNVDLARHNSDTFATKEIEQKTELALNRQKLVRLQLVQEAVVPWKPAFPTMTLKLVTGALRFADPCRPGDCVAKKPNRQIRSGGFRSTCAEFFRLRSRPARSTFPPP